MSCPRQSSLAHHGVLNAPALVQTPVAGNGVVRFGTSVDKEFNLHGAKDTFSSEEQIAWIASLTRDVKGEPVTLVILKVDCGTERTVYSETDPSVSSDADEFAFTIYADARTTYHTYAPGEYVVRYLAGITTVAHGRFTVRG